MANKPEFGDDSLWHLAIQSYYPRIVNYVYFLTQDRFLAEDIAQETFAKGIAKFYQLKDPDKFFPWLLSIAINTGRTQIERNKRSIPAWIRNYIFPSYLLMSPQKNYLNDKKRQP